MMMIRKCNRGHGDCGREVHECIRCQHDLSDDVEGRDQNVLCSMDNHRMHYFDIRLFRREIVCKNLTKENVLIAVFDGEKLGKQLILRQLLLLLKMVVVVMVFVRRTENY